jgi:hypothetical protein
MKNTEKTIDAMSPLEIVDNVSSRSQVELKDLVRIAKGRLHTMSTKKKTVAHMAPAD